VVLQTKIGRSEEELFAILAAELVVLAGYCDGTSWAKAQGLKSSIFENLKLRN
jgi:hypothetical protein